MEGDDPTEYAHKDKEIAKKFFHGFDGVAGPYTLYRGRKFRMNILPNFEGFTYQSESE